MKKILLLINPFSGSRSSEYAQACAADMAEVASAGDFYIQTHIIKGFADSRRATLDAVKNGFYAVVVVGGDGTANSTGALLKGSATALGIIPSGSGNGVARHIGMDTDLKRAFSQILACRRFQADTMEVNGRFCLGFAGMGFEAHVAHTFSQSKYRGLVSYSAAAISEFFRYSPSAVHLDVDGQGISRTPFTLTFANSSQWGNDFRIAPGASMCSGTMKLVVLSDINQINAVQAAYSLYKGKIDKFPSCETIDACQVVVTGENLVYHIDGEPFAPTDRLEVTLHPASLKVLSPSRKI